MKIYRKRNFIAGLTCLGLAAVCSGLMAAQGVSGRLLAGAVLGLAGGWAGLAWAMDRSLRTPVPDERDRQVAQRSAWRAYRLLLDGCMLAAGLAMLALGLWRSPLLLAVLLTLAGVVTAAFLLLLGASLYYEKHM